MLFAIGGSLDTSLPLSPVNLPLVRNFKILSAIVFFMGFILPNWTNRQLQNKIDLIFKIVIIFLYCNEELIWIQN
jgi:hypothetical protein